MSNKNRSNQPQKKDIIMNNDQTKNTDTEAPTEVLKSVEQDGDTIIANFITSDDGVAKVDSEVISQQETTKVTVTQIPIAEPTPVVVVADLNVKVDALEVPCDVYQLPLSSSPLARLTIQELKDYVERASIRVRLTEQEAAGLQMGLFHTMLQLINLDAQNFDDAFNLAMRIIRDNTDGCFSGENVHRYTPNITLPKQQATSFRLLVNAFTALADPSPAARTIAKRQVNIEQALSNPKIKEESRQRVMTFFGY